MAKRRSRRRLPEGEFSAFIESMSHDGRGVSHVDGKTVFVHGALPGERVLFRYSRVSSQHDEGVVSQVLEQSQDRVEPECERFGLCGGCSLQHLVPEQQILAKQQTLLDNLQRIGKVQPERVLDPLTGDVYALADFESDGRKTRFGNLPLADYPLVILERDEIAL